MLKRITVLIIIGLSLFSCAKKSTEWNEKHIMNLIVTIPLMGNPMDLDIAGQHVYIAEDQGGLSIVNISNYTKKWMNRIVSIDGDTLDLVKTRRLSVDLSMNRLFINETEGSDEIRVIDITNLDSLKIIDRISGGTQDINYMKFNKITDVNNVYFYEGIFCSGRNVNYGRHGFHITGIPPFFAVDLPIETSATGRGAFLGNQYIYAAIEQRGLAIYNRTNGALISEIDLPGEAQKVVV
ncbi:MAG: hypothetical protein FJ041_03890, partial [Candidatus Cloacimonetes bacterium]|nr:hypothetical protein [Candidatus Cloacimonadota bacterium]